MKLEEVQRMQNELAAVLSHTEYHSKERRFMAVEVINNWGARLGQLVHEEVERAKHRKPADHIIPDAALQDLTDNFEYVRHFPQEFQKEHFRSNFGSYLFDFRAHIENMIHYLNNRTANVWHTIGHERVVNEDVIVKGFITGNENLTKNFYRMGRFDHDGNLSIQEQPGNKFFPQYYQFFRK